MSTATRSRNRMLVDGEEIHFPCTTSLGVPSPRGLGVSIDSVDSTNIQARSFPYSSLPYPTSAGPVFAEGRRRTSIRAWERMRVTFRLVSICCNAPPCESVPPEVAAWPFETSRKTDIAAGLQHPYVSTAIAVNLVFASSASSRCFRLCSTAYLSANDPAATMLASRTRSVYFCC